LSNIIKVINQEVWDKCSTGDNRNASRGFVAKSEGKRQLGKPRCRGRVILK
jgi:hypothetical protein